jgi:hypothetical protein
MKDDPKGTTGLDTRDRPGAARPLLTPAPAASNAHTRALGGTARPVAAAGPRYDSRAVFDPVQIRLDSKSAAT